MEHSYVENNFVNTLPISVTRTESIEVILWVWCGDYADDIRGKTIDIARVSSNTDEDVRLEE